jgi:hypothetical protein
MIAALLWLTISLPFVFEAQQQLQKQHLIDNTFPGTAQEESGDDCNPFGNNTEEKTESSSNSLSEYLHHIDELHHLTALAHKHNCSHSFSVYVAFHGELLTPPPNFTL